MDEDDKDLVRDDDVEDVREDDADLLEPDLDSDEVEDEVEEDDVIEYESEVLDEVDLDDEDEVESDEHELELDVMLNADNEWIILSLRFLSDVLRKSSE